jgi:chemotaxis signal transduction protein
VFQAGGRRLAASLADVIQVVTAPAVCPVPLLPAHLWGILHHERALHVVADAAALFGAQSERPPPLAVLLDVPGVPLAIAATRVEGIRTGLRLSSEPAVPGAWVLEDADGAVHLPRYDRLVEHV